MMRVSGTARIGVMGSSTVYLVRRDGGNAMKSRMVWSLSVLLLLVCGMIGCGAGVEDPKPAVEKAVAAQKECSQRLGSPVEITNSIGMKFALIPAGEFLMGSPESVSYVSSDEKLQHKVRITKPFYLGLYEVTQAEYDKVMGENPSDFSKGGSVADRVSGKDTSGYPVEMVSWEDAVEFCKRLSAKEGKTYRLPSEAEWEYACRAGTTTKWYCGDNEAELGRVAWYGEHRGGTTHPVGAKEANAWGLFDMHGNVWEWCQDWHGPYSSGEAIDPTGPSDATFRVLRGGSWYDRAVLCRSAFRLRYAPGLRDFFVGFRVARSPSGK
jgi:formylglycine-generating enzyme required for sulfatase activity